MPALFRIIDTETALHSRPAPLNGREVAALRLLLQNEGRFAMLDSGEDDGTATKFEYNANAIAVASFASIFKERDDVIAVIEEAQFLGRNIRVDRDHADEQLYLEVSSEIALSPPIAVTFEQADRVLECIGIDGAGKDKMPLARLREVLHSPSTAHRFDESNLSNIFDYLARMADTDCGEQLPHLAWA